MRSQWSLTLFALFALFSPHSFAGDLQYYFRYKNTVSNIIVDYEKLKSACKIQTQEKCVDLEVYARNLLIQKVTAYKDYSDGVVGNFESVFPRLLTPDAKQELNQHNSAILDARYFASFAQVSNLSELEKTLNGLLKKNAPLLNILSATFHLYKAGELHKALVGTHKNLESEVKLAQDAGIDVDVAKRNMADAKKHLENAEVLLDKTKKQFKNQTSSQVSPEVLQNISIIYTDLASASTSMLKATQVLGRFAERFYW